MMKKILFDYSKLKGRIKEKCGSQKSFAELLEISEASLTAKLNCDSYFSQGEIAKSCEILDILPDRIFLYFFRREFKNLNSEVK